MLELLKEAVPDISRVAVLWNPDHADPEYRETLRAANARGTELQSLEVRRPGDFDGAFEAAKRERAEGMVIVSSRLLLLQKQKIVQFGADNRIIMVGTGPTGPRTECCSPMDQVRRRDEAHRVLPGQGHRGARPTDLPMERPTRFDLTINQKAANTLGVKFPNAMLVRADAVID